MSSEIIVLILGGNSEIGAHVCSDLGLFDEGVKGSYLDRERPKNKFFLRKVLLSFLPEQNVFSYHLI